MAVESTKPQAAKAGKVLDDLTVKKMIAEALAAQKAELEAKYAASSKPESVAIGPSVSKKERSVMPDSPFLTVRGNWNPHGLTVTKLRRFGRMVFGTDKFLPEIEQALKAYDPKAIAEEWRKLGYTVKRGKGHENE